MSTYLTNSSLISSKGSILLFLSVMLIELKNQCSSMVYLFPEITLWEQAGRICQVINFTEVNKVRKSFDVYQQRRASNMTNYLGCFLIGATGIGNTVDGNALIGSVSDDPYDIRTFLRTVSSDKGYSLIGTELVSTTEHTLTERGYFAKPGETTRGMNQAGLSFTCAMIIEDESAPRTGRMTEYSDLTAKILKECVTVEGAIAVFESAGKVHPAYTVLLADAQGGLAQLEVGSFGVNVNQHFSRDNPGCVFSVNCYVSDALEKYNAPHTALSDGTNNNLKRLKRGQELVGKLAVKIDVHVLAAILSDHANRELDPMSNPILEGWGFSICNHGTRSKDDYPHEDLPWGTVSSEIMQPSTGLFWYAYGWPCGGRPEYGDQIYQENSWGKYLPFSLNDSETKHSAVPLTTVEGVITAAGARALQSPSNHRTKY